jgi:transcriptional regulator with XRE-family HTH domain
MTKRLERLRTRQCLSKAELGRRAGVQAIHISWAEQTPTRFIPYPGALKRLAEALGYWGDPEDLLKEVPDDSDA